MAVHLPTGQSELLPFLDFYYTRWWLSCGLKDCRASVSGTRDRDDDLSSQDDEFGTCQKKKERETMSSGLRIWWAWHKLGQRAPGPSVSVPAARACVKTDTGPVLHPLILRPAQAGPGDPHLAYAPTHRPGRTALPATYAVKDISEGTNSISARRTSKLRLGNYNERLKFLEGWHSCILPPESAIIRLSGGHSQLQTQNTTNTCCSENLWPANARSKMECMIIQWNNKTVV